MSFPLNAYLIAFVSASLAAWLSLPLWRARCLRSGLVDDPGHRKIHDAPVPLAGGFAVLTGVGLPLLTGAIALLIRAALSGGSAGESSDLLKFPGGDAANLLEYGLSRRAIQLAGILFGALGMTALGWFDDRHELKPAAKFAGQLLIASLVAATGTRITLFVANPLFQYAVTVLWILTVTNAFNFMDNMNGLCAGLGAISAGLFGLLAAMNGHYLVALMGFLTCGALVGFLPHNFPGARAFLGDAGSHLTGYLLSILAILPHFHTPENPRPLAVLTPLLVLAVPLGDLVWVVMLRWKRGQPFYVGDTNHLSHRLVRRGFSKPKAVVLIWLVSAGVGSLAFFRF